MNNPFVPLLNTTRTKRLFKSGPTITYARIIATIRTIYMVIRFAGPPESHCIIKSRDNVQPADREKDKSAQGEVHAF